jgi:hypothetical protein
MWILPKQLHTSAFVPDTEALISDLNEQSQVCAQSLLARSKPSPARTWLQRWKRDSWTAHLSGRILKPSHGPSFVTAWTSSLAATRASHSAQPASDSAPKTHDTSGRLSQPELLQCDQVSVSLKTSRDISALGYPTCCKTWSDWVTERRGAWRQRVNAVRLTRGSGSLSWRTPTEAETHNQDYSSQTYLQNQVNWPSPVASEVRQGFQDRSKGMKGSQESLTTVVIKHGQAAPASSSSLGSRQGLWMTPRACQAQNPPMGVDKRHHGLTHQVTKQWATPRANERDGTRTPNGNPAKDGIPLGMQARQWGAPTARDHKSGRGNEQREYKELTPMVERRQSGKLNPRWVETLMGLPIGWTMPSCIRPVTIAQTSCDSSGTALCQPSQSERSDFFLAS